MKAANPKSNYNYIVEDDRELPKEEQTVFVLSHLTLEQEEYLDNRVGQVNDDGYAVNAGTIPLIRLHLGLVEIQNFFDNNGKPITLERDKTKKSSLPGVGRPWKTSILQKIEKKYREEIAEAIQKGVELSEDELKNSQSCQESSTEK